MRKYNFFILKMSGSDLFLDYSSNNKRSDNFDKSYESFKPEESESNSVTNSNKLKKIVKINNTIINNTNINNGSTIINENNTIINKYFSQINPDLNYQKLIEELLKNYNDMENKNKQLKASEKHNGNKSISYNNNGNHILSLTRMNSNDSISILQSSIINAEEINELTKAKIKAYSSELNKNNLNKKIKEIYKSFQKQKSEAKKKLNDSESNDLKEKEEKAQKEKREFYKAKDKIKNFREKYKIFDIIKYPDDIIFYFLKENNYKKEEAYKSFLEYYE